MASQLRVFEPISEKYLMLLISLQKGVNPAMASAIIEFMLSDELMSTWGGAAAICKKYQIHTSSFNQQIAKMLEKQKVISAMLEEVRASGYKEPLSFTLVDTK